jgi:hypothetical protein
MIRRESLHRLTLGGLASLLALTPRPPASADVPAVVAPDAPAGPPPPELADYYYVHMGSDRDPNSPTRAEECQRVHDCLGHINSRPMDGRCPGTVRFERYTGGRNWVDLEPELDPETGLRWAKSEPVGPVQFAYMFAVRKAGWTPQADHRNGPRRLDDFESLWLPGDSWRRPWAWEDGHLSESGWEWTHGRKPGWA